MKIEDILQKQAVNNRKVNELKASTLTIEEYTKDKNSPRPYRNIEEKKNKGGLISVKKDFTRRIIKRTDGSKTYLDKKPLSEVSKVLMKEILRLCLYNNSLSTGPIKKNDLSLKINVKKGTIRTTCIRLKEIGILENYTASKGRNSEWCFYITQEIADKLKEL